MKTTDLCDVHDVEVLCLPWRSFGGRARFFGQVTTLKVFEDNAQVRAILSEQVSTPRVLVVDGTGSMRSALLGDQLAALAQKQGWAGVVVVGAVRDSAMLREIDVGVVALGTVPRKSAKIGNGIRGVELTIAGIRLSDGDWIYCDEDGVVTARVPVAG